MQRRHEVSIRNVKDEVTADSASYMRLLSRQFQSVSRPPPRDTLSLLVLNLRLTADSQKTSSLSI